jgi:hypothetical protein
MKRHYKFIGGPWDGEYHEIDDRQYDVDVRVPVRVPLKVSFKVEPLEEPVLDDAGEPVLDDDGEPVLRIIKPDPTAYTRYTMRHWAGEGGDLYWYAPDNWTDIYTLSQLVHHYPGRP